VTVGADNTGVTRRLVLAAAGLALVAGCGGGSSGSHGTSAYSLAQQACQTSGQTAADLATQAASLDPRYAQLAADERALAANIGEQQPTSTAGDEGNLQGVTGEQGTGPGSSYQVLKDCADLAKSLIP
jgi:hypothetical protein